MVRHAKCPGVESPSVTAKGEVFPNQGIEQRRIMKRRGKSVLEEQRADDVLDAPHRPSSRTRARAKVRARSEQPASLPEPFWSNPFRVLRLPAGAPASQIRETIEQARIEARLGSNPEAESKLDVLTRAQAELLDPSKRVQHEVLWFYAPPESLQQGVVNNEEAMVARFQDRMLEAGDAAWLRQHDLALGLLIAASLDRDPQSAEHWTVRALSAWRDLARNPRYLRGLPADNRRSAGATANAVWALGLDVLAAATLRSVNAGNVDGVLSRHRAAKACGVEDEDLLRIMEPTIEAALLDAQRRLAEAQAESKRIANDPDAARRWAKALTDGLSICRYLHDELSEIEARQLENVLDEGASLIRDVAITLYNEHSEREAAAKLLEAALSLAASPKLVERLESDQRALSDTMKPLAERDAASLERFVEPLLLRYERAAQLIQSTATDSSLQPVSLEALPLFCEVCGVCNESVKRSVLVYTVGLVVISWRIPRVITMCAAHRAIAGILAVTENLLLGLWGGWAILWTLQCIWSNAAGGRRDELTNLRHLAVLALKAAREADRERLVHVLSEIRTTDREPTVREYISTLLTGDRTF